MNTIIEQYTKGTPQILFGGAINASVSEINSSVIDMTTYMGGSLEVTENSGTGTWSIALYESAVNAGVFKPGLIAAGTAITISIPDGGGACDIGNIRANYIKFVPTLSGTSNITVKFTPSPI